MYETCTLFCYMQILLISGKRHFCQNSSETYSGVVHIEYNDDEVKYKECTCSVTGANNMTINEYRSLKQAVSCPSTLRVNNDIYTCTAHSGHSSPLTVVLSENTTLTLSIQSHSNPPLLRLQLVGKYYFELIRQLSFYLFSFLNFGLN